MNRAKYDRQKAEFEAYWRELVASDPAALKRLTFIRDAKYIRLSESKFKVRALVVLELVLWVTLISAVITFIQYGLSADWYLWRGYPRTLWRVFTTGDRYAR